MQDARSFLFGRLLDTFAECADITLNADQRFVLRAFVDTVCDALPDDNPEV